MLDLTACEGRVTRGYPTVAAAVAALRTPMILDGEIVAVDEHGQPSLQTFQHRTTTSPETIVFYAFDLLAIGGEDWTSKPLEARRTRLARAVKGSTLLLSSPLEGDAQTIEATIGSFGLEGIAAKRLGSRFRPGERTDDRVKVKFSPHQEFVVGGFLPNGRSLDFLVVGYFDRRQLKFAAQVRAGLTPQRGSDNLARAAPHRYDCGMEPRSRLYPPVRPTVVVEWTLPRADRKALRRAVAGVPRSAAMAMVGYKTEAIYRRYAIVDAGALREAAARIDRVANLIGSPLGTVSDVAR